MTLIYLALAWMAGIVLAERFAPDPALPLLVAILLLPGIFVLRKEKPILLWIVLFFVLGLLRFESARPAVQANHVVHLNDQGILTLRGVIIAEPETLDTGLRILVEAKEAAGKQVQGRVLATVPRFSDLAYGDEVSLFGILVTPPELDGFSYRDYLVRQKVFSLMPGAEAEVLRHDQGSPIYAALLDLKNEAREVITDSLPEPHASLLEGILLGDDSGLSDETKANFTKTGTSHIIAISGFNMVILAEFMMVILNRLMPKRRVTAAAFGIGTIILYTIFVGAGGAVIRAAVMSALLILGRAIYRKTYVPASIAFAVLLLSAYDPWSLWDVGFQLSLAAVMGMAIFVDPLTRIFNAALEKITAQENAQRLMGIFSDSLIVTTAAQITTTPLILYYFGRLSIVTLLVNFLIIPAQTPILFFGAIGVLVGLFVPALGDLILNIAWVFLSWTVESVDYFAKLSWADRELSLSRMAVLIFFTGLLLWTLYHAIRPRWLMGWKWQLQVPVWAVRGAAVVALILLVNSVMARPDGNLHVTFLEVGHSNAILIETPRGASILIDGGRLPTRLLDSLGDALPDRSRKIDVLVITSTSQDEMAALPEVVDRYQIGAVMTTGQTSPEPYYTALIEQISAKNIPLTAATAGYQLKTDDGVILEVLYPTAIPDQNAEAASAAMVLRLTYGEAVFLFTSEIDAAVEAELLQQPHLLQANVLQVADHGSDNANTAPFINVVNPQTAILQLDSGNTQGDPAPIVLDRLAATQLFRSDQNGNIEITTDGKTLLISTERP